MPNYSGIWTEQAVMQANGAGNWPNAPGAPTIGTATNTGAGGTVSVAFTAPTFAGLPAVITSYTVTSSPGGLTGTGASSPITVSGLTDGTAYTFTVTATNSSGTGPASAASNSVTPTLVVYIEETFSTYLYTGNGSTQTITNGIDLSTKGGMTWIKQRSATRDNLLFDTVRGATQRLFSNLTVAQSVDTQSLTAFTTSGFSVGSDSGANINAGTYASWTFREQPKFFDVVTYTGDGVTGRTVAHNLGSTPGMIIVKGVDIARGWFCYHQSLGATKYIELSSTGAATTDSTFWSDTAPTSTNFTVGGASQVNLAGYTYVAYLFAHNAGGFGLTGTDNVISCGSFVPDGSGNATVSLGYEPQWVLTQSTSGGSWQIQDSMRGMPVGGQGQRLRPNSSAAEDTTDTIRPNATGFSVTSFGASQTYIYIAIRRGPMKVPTTGTSVFDADTLTPAANLTGTKVTNPFAMDFLLTAQRDHSGLPSTYAVDRLRGGTQGVTTNSTSAEFTSNTYNWKLDYNDGFVDNFAYPEGTVTTPMIYWSFKRAPGFFDEVCYTGTGSNLTLPHNLTVAPELIIAKVRSTSSSWGVSTSTDWTKYLLLNSTNAQASASLFGTPDATNFYPTASGGFSGSGNTYVAYLFATCPGVSKVGSYTGTATTLQIDCGFTAGSRFVMIKRTDSTGDWYVWDSARGIVAGNDPYLLLNSPAVEVTNTDYVDTAATGFEISSTAPAAINASGGTYIFLAIA